MYDLIKASDMLQRCRNESQFSNVTYENIYFHPQMQKCKNRGSSSTQQQNFAFTISLAFAAVKIREI